MNDSAAPARSRGLLALAMLLGPGAVLISIGLLFWPGMVLDPWIVAISATLALVLGWTASRGLKPGLRVLLLAVLGLTAVFAWSYPTWMTKTESYSGPRVGTTLPEFRLTRADGEAIDREALLAPGAVAMVFYRGW
ncbi:MAG: hypothetical protein KDB18_13760 [Salinibacterium sp.]|nr:hypothetical protein [Planctomycetota bacterium]MCB1282584.1 hypothetical protein [Salinibacterium sp.]